MGAPPGGSTITQCEQDGLGCCKPSRHRTLVSASREFCTPGSTTSAGIGSGLWKDKRRLMLSVRKRRVLWECPPGYDVACDDPPAGARLGARVHGLELKCAGIAEGGASQHDRSPRVAARVTGAGVMLA
jgi:hypothetical protein